MRGKGKGQGAALALSAKAHAATRLLLVESQEKIVKGRALCDVFRPAEAPCASVGDGRGSGRVPPPE
jgi:hypothetical protein